MSTIFTLNHILNYSLKVVRKTPAIVVSLRMTESEGTKATVEQSLLPTEGSVTVQKTTEGTGDVPVMDSTAAPEKTQATSSKRTKRSKSSRKNT